MVYLVHGNAYFSRPGPRLIDSLEILAHILHPNLHRFPDNVQPIHRVSPKELGISESASTWD